MWGGEIRRCILQTRCISNSLTSVSYLKKSLFFLKILMMLFLSTYHIGGSVFLKYTTPLDKIKISFQILFYQKHFIYFCLHLPHVSAKPQCCSWIGLIFSNKNRMWYRQQTYKCSVLKKS